MKNVGRRENYILYASDVKGVLFVLEKWISNNSGDYTRDLDVLVPHEAISATMYIEIRRKSPKGTR